MSVSKTSTGWLRGPPGRRGGTSSLARSGSSTPTQAASTSSTIFYGGVKDATGKVSEYSAMDDQCPVCKSDRYLNPKLRLLVSSCYHKMCESCIDRLFTLGPAPCPICTKILRKLAFTPQTFEDLVVEKEVAVRRRITKDFNKRQEDFVDLRSYNDYLEEVEDITFNLINEIDIPATEARIAAFKKDNAALIELNLQREENYALGLKEEEERDRLEREERARELRKEEELERAEKVKEKKEIIDRLETSTTSAKKVVAKSRAEAQKRHSALRTNTTSLLRNARNRSAPTVVQDGPHVPLSDDWDSCDDKFTLRRNYDDPISEAVRADKEGWMRAGGYRIDEAWERALRCAVSGLSIRPLDKSDLDMIAPV